MYKTTGNLATELDVTRDTIRRWANQGKIDSITTPGGHRRVRLTNIPRGRKSYIYARVSSQKQKEDLKKQVIYMQELYPGFKVIQDIGSGINFKRKGLCRLLDLVLSGQVETIAIAYKDRLCRIGFDLIRLLCDRMATDIDVANRTTSDGTEFATDLIEIVTFYTAKYYGSRKYKSNTKANIPKQKTKRIFYKGATRFNHRL